MTPFNCPPLIPIPRSPSPRSVQLCVPYTSQTATQKANVYVCVQERDCDMMKCVGCVSSGGQQWGVTLFSLALSAL
jgi:hypothetical protein